MRRASLDPGRVGVGGIAPVHTALPKVTPAFPRYQVSGARQEMGTRDSAEEVPIGFLATSQWTVHDGKVTCQGPKGPVTRHFPRPRVNSKGSHRRLAACRAIAARQLASHACTHLDLLPRLA